MSIKLYDVAKQANVSIPTASFVLNNNYQIKISPATRNRVKEVAKRLDYRPNAIARGLSTGQTRSLGLLVPLVTTPFYDEIIRGVEIIAITKGYTVTLGCSNLEPEREKKYINIFQDKRVEGMLVSAFDRSNIDIFLQLKDKIPIVFIDSYLPEIDTDYVVTDNFSGSYSAVKDLVAKGCKKIIYIGRRNVQVLEERFQGYLQALKENKLNWTSELFLEKNSEEAVTHILNKVKPDAIFLVSFTEIMMILHVLHRLGLKVPRDLQISGFDEPFLRVEKSEDIEVINVLEEPIPVVIQPRYEMSKKAVEILIDKIEGGIENHQTQRVMLKPILKKRC